MLGATKTEGGKMARGLRKSQASDPARAGDPTLTMTMTACLAKLREQGPLVRLPGGYWVREGVGFSGSTPAESWDGTPTIEALVRRGLAEYTDWQKGRGAMFPVAVKAT